MNINKYFVVPLLWLMVCGACAQIKEAKLRTLIIMFDGLRPDYITPENMPNLYALKKRGSYGNDNHSVFPTVTRLNASSYVTGSYPAKHGILGNSVYFPKVDKTKIWNTGEAAEMMHLAETSPTKLFTTISLGELMQQAGEKLMVFSSGSSGQAFLQNHTVSGGAVIHPEVILPLSLKEDLLKKLGPIPAHAKPNNAQHIWATNAFLLYALAPEGPLVSAIWFSDPDGTAHSEGIGSPLAMESIRNVDHELGRILEALNSKGLTDSVNIIISTDHGFVTDIGTHGLTDFLIQQGFKTDNDSEDVVVAGGAIYVKDHDLTKIKKIVALLQEQEWIGAIFTRSNKPGEAKGYVEGTLSFETINWNHTERAADILADYNWVDRKNHFGYEGASYSEGVAGHGGSSPYEIHIPLIVSGPGFKKGYESALPTSNVDIVPTILHLHQLPIPSSMDGRVMKELLNTPSDQTKEVAKKETIETSVKHGWGTYTLTLERSFLNKYYYVNHTKVTRNFKKAKTK